MYYGTYTQLRRRTWLDKNGFSYLIIETFRVYTTNGNNYDITRSQYLKLINGNRKKKI